ncbi:VOC family protein [Nocardioides jiangxiensis]|uniref:Glyoxalase/fosfomycin resistance/dioxygenase domain-containing protein n=1 Tax=Nocardioides jiangxiensis TaxID=3064524 RepID=A0ABT9B336_9ACTN|nr:VOC family protein [Nocardioides sp. WY-20]MDO7869254.1 hypothetical protein [Nocardioides sp. WY-20]
MTITIEEIQVGDDAAAWAAAGFAVVGDTCRVGGVDLRLVGAAGQRGVHTWVLAGADDAAAGAFARAEGVPTVVAAARAQRPAGEHPLGVAQVDHLVLMTPNVDRTTASLEALGLPVRRVRDAELAGSPVRQVFFRLGEVILEVIGAPTGTGAGPATFWGITHTVSDIDAAAAYLGERCGRVKEAVQPGRRIATVRTRDLGLSVATALISPQPPRE